MFILCGMVGASAEEALIRKIGTRVECDELDSHSSWSWAERTRRDRQCRDASRGLIKRTGNDLTLQFRGKHLAKYSDNQKACISEIYNKCSYVRAVSFSFDDLFVVLSVNSGLESMEYLFVDLASGDTLPLGGRPQFSPSGQQFIVLSDAFSAMSDDFVIYQVNAGKLTQVAAFPANKEDRGHIWSLVRWTLEDEILIKTSDEDPQTHVQIEVTASVRRMRDGSWTVIGWPPQ
jgi:hypothetical protein